MLIIYTSGFIGFGVGFFKQLEERKERKINGKSSNYLKGLNLAPARASFKSLGQSAWNTCTLFLCLIL